MFFRQMVVTGVDLVESRSLHLYTTTVMLIQRCYFRRSLETFFFLKVEKFWDVMCGFSIG